MLDEWVNRRLDTPFKLKNIEKMSRVFDLVDKYKTPFFDDVKNPYRPSLQEGSPVVEWVKLFRHYQHREYFKTDIWKDIEPVIFSLPYKYDIDYKSIEYDFDIAVFLQARLPSFVCENVDRQIMQAVEDGYRVVVKPHPSLNTSNLSCSDMIRFEEDADPNQMIQQCSWVASTGSSLMLNAIASGKPISSLMPSDVSYLAGVSDILNPVSYDDGYSFLTWYRDVYCIDINDHKADSRIEHRLKNIALCKTKSQILEIETRSQIYQ